MYRLSKYIIESVSRGKSGKYRNTFPMDVEQLSRERLVNFLEIEGFKEVQNISHGIGKVYQVGACDPESPETFWVRFADWSRKQNNMYFCRFKNFGMPGFSDFISFGKTLSFDEFREDVCEFFGFE